MLTLCVEQNIFLDNLENKRGYRIMNVRGNSCQNTILNKVLFDQVKVLLSEGMKQKKVAELTGVQQTYISYIKNGAVWTCYGLKRLV